MNEYKQLSDNIIKTGRYKTIKSLAAKLGVRPQSLSAFRSGHSKSEPALKKLRKIWGGIKGSPYIFVFIAVQRSHKYIFGKVVKTISKFSIDEFLSFLPDSVGVIYIARYNQATKTRLKESDVGEWIQIAKSFGKEFTNFDEFRNQLISVLGGV